MKFVVSAAVLLLLAALACSQLEGANASANKLQANSNSAANSATGQHITGNVIEHSSAKSRLEAEKRQVQDFLNAKTIIKSIVKLFFGTSDEINATSRHVLGILTKVLDLLKNTFGQKGRSGSARTIRDSAEDAASAGVSMLQGYVKSVLAPDDRCVQRYLCQASKEATRDGRELGYVIASVGGYASSYLLDSSKSATFNSLYEATKKGRNMAEDCAKLYADCPESSQ